jgi:phosphate transport system substrate-binding protein
MAVVVNPKATWVDQMTIDELKRLWSPEARGKITRWSQIREGWPDEEIHLFGAGADSGTYDYFTAAIVGKEHSSRGDYRQSEDDNVLVQGGQQRRRRPRLLRLRLLRREPGQAEGRPDRQRQGRGR